MNNVNMNTSKGKENVERPKRREIPRPSKTGPTKPRVWNSSTNPKSKLAYIHADPLKRRSENQKVSSDHNKSTNSEAKSVRSPIPVHIDLSKRKRNESASSAKSGGGNTPKRNPMRPKCKTDFMPIPDMKFGFKAINDPKKFSGTSGTTLGITKGREAKGTYSTRPVGKLRELEEQIKALQQECQSSKAKVDEYEKENKQLKDRLEESNKLYTGTVEDQAKTLEITSNLKSKIEKCEHKLHQCNIDPISLENMEPGESDREVIEKKRTEAKTRASTLREKLERLNETSLYYVHNIKEIIQNFDR